MDLEVRDDNSVRFTIFSPTAASKAESISRAVSDSRFRFTYDDETYRAEPSTFVSHQASRKAGDSSILFWGENSQSCRNTCHLNSL